MTVRVLLTPIGSAGDTLPFIGLGRELARRGHDVTIATSAPFAEFVLRSGVAFVETATDEEYRLATDDPNLFHPVKGFAAVMERVADYNERLFEIISAHGAHDDATVVAHGLDFVSHAIAEKTGLKAVRVHLQPSMLRTTYELPVTYGTVNWSFLPRVLKRALWRLVDRMMIDPASAPHVNAIRVVHHGGVGTTAAALAAGDRVGGEKRCLTRFLRPGKNSAWHGFFDQNVRRHRT